MYNLPNIEAVAAGAKEYREPQTQIEPLTPAAEAYLTQTRGLLPQALKAFRVGCNARGEIAVPFYDEGGNLKLVKFRHPEGGKLKRRRKLSDGSFQDYEAKSVIEPGGAPVLLGSHLCDPREGPLVVCFGDYDAISVAQDGVPNAVSLPFGDKGLDFIGLQWDFLEKFSEIIFFRDRDSFATPELELAAQRKFDEMCVRLGRHRCKTVRPEDYHGCKDPNEIYMKFGAGYLLDAVARAEWLPSGIVAVADHQDAPLEEGTPLGLTDVDRATGGLSGGDLVVVSGDNGSGKTTEVLNWCAEFVEQRQPVFYWSGEQKVGKIRYWFERVAAGRLRLRRVVSEKTGFEYFFPLDECLAPLRSWYRDYLFQYTKIGVSPQEFFEAAEIGVRRHGCRMIVIDNLMAFTGGEGEGYYQAQGDFAENCKSFAEKFNVVVVLIVHNKKEDGKGLPDKNSIEGSKKISNWADKVFQMFRVPENLKVDYGNADSVLGLVKNRESGVIEYVRLRFDRESNRFAQMTEEERVLRPFGWERNFYG